MKPESVWDRLANNRDTPGVSLGQNEMTDRRKTAWILGTCY
jgi:hypothetical protein